MISYWDFSGFSGTDLHETNNVSQSDDTVRVDPLDNFNKYRGGYDITNKHYWSVILSHPLLSHKNNKF